MTTVKDAAELDPPVQQALSELKALIVQCYPNATFRVTRSPEDRDVILLKPLVDVDDRARHGVLATGCCCAARRFARAEATARSTSRSSSSSGTSLKAARVSSMTRKAASRSASSFRKRRRSRAEIIAATGMPLF